VPTTIKHFLLKFELGRKVIPLPIQSYADVFYGFGMPQRYSSEDAN
jgi:hypothetical protein